MIENINYATNSELEQMLSELSVKFEEHKKNAINSMLQMELLEKKYKEVTDVLKKRNVRNEQ